MKIFFASVLLAAAASFADEVLQFMPDPYEVGEISQGDVRHVNLGGANVSAKVVEIESVHCQGVGCSNFRFPKAVKPRDPVNVEFDFSSESLEGAFSNVVVLVEPNGTPHPVAFQGSVKAPFLFSEKLFDAGYYKSGDKREWTFYVWNADGKTLPDLTLSAESSEEFSAETKNVKLNLQKPDAVKEGGKVPGLKVTLRTKGLSRAGSQKSLSKIVSFRSAAFPKATPEVLIVGYWK